MIDTDRETKAELVGQIADLVSEKYVLPEVGERVAAHLRHGLAEDAAFLDLAPADLAEALTKELHTISGDTHLRLDYDPHRAASGRDSDELLRQHFEQARRHNFGFARAERLVGNIGYLLLCELPPPEVGGEVAAGAMAFVANTGALILDLRGNGGGSPEMVQLLISYLVDSEPQPLSAIHARGADQPEAFRTLSEIPGQRLPDFPVYVLVDGQTHSAAEALAYDLQALQRATVVGARTRGGAHLVDFYPLYGTFVLMLPIARAINPITGQNWQGVGVKPDIEAPADDALQVAHRAALKELLALAADADERAFLQAEMETLARD